MDVKMVQDIDFEFMRIAAVITSGYASREKVTLQDIADFYKNVLFQLPGTYKEFKERTG